MGGKRTFRGLTWRALLPVLIASAAVGVMGSQVVAAAGLTPHPAASRPPASRLHAATAPGSGTGSSIAASPATTPLATDAASLDPPPSGPPPFVTAPTTVAQVAQDLIAAIDTQSKGVYAIAATPTNLTLLESWMANEGGLWADNPLNTSLDAGRYPHQITTAGQNTGIPIYPSIAIGVDATATTLLTNHAYADILAVLDQSDADCSDFARAVIDSPWAASHYGHDPTRFCGASTGAGTVPVVTACLRLPATGKRSALRATRVPGACGRFAPHAGQPNHANRPNGRRSASHRSSSSRAAHHPAVRHGAARHAAVRPSGSRPHPGWHTVGAHRSRPRR